MADRSAAAELAAEVHGSMKRFSGLLIPGDVLSDRSPKFAEGKRVVISRGALQRALPSLIGKELNCAPDFLHHELERPIGRITHSYLVAGFLYITGLLYPEWDFPEFAERVAEGDLGLSAELADVAFLEHIKACIIGVHTLSFTGAAVAKRERCAWSITDFRLSPDGWAVEEEAAELAAA